MPGRYREYGRSDDPVVEEMDSGFVGFNSRLRPDQLDQGVLSLSENGRLDVNGEWQVRKGVDVLNPPFTVGADSVRLPTSAEFVSLPNGDPGPDPTSNIARLPFIPEGIEINGTTVTVDLIGHIYLEGDEIELVGVVPGALPDPNGIHTIDTVTADSFTFEITDTGTGSYTITEGQNTTLVFQLPFDPVNQTQSTTLFNPSVGTLLLDESATSFVRSATSYSDPNVDAGSPNSQYILLCTSRIVKAINLFTGQNFNCLIPSNESIIPQADMLQVFNRIFIFRNGQVALENKKFFEPIRIKSATISTDEVTIETFIPHGLDVDNKIGITNIGFTSNDPNGIQDIISTTSTTITYQVDSSVADTYTVDETTNIVPAFLPVKNGEFAQPLTITVEDKDFVIDDGTCTISNFINFGDTAIEATDTIEIRFAQDNSELGALVGKFFDVVSATPSTDASTDDGELTFFVDHPDFTSNNSHDIQFGKPVSISLGFTHMPMPEFGVYHQRRLVVPYRFVQSTDDILGTIITPNGVKDEILFSDILDSDTYDQVYAKFRFNAGTSDFLVGLHSFSDDKLLVFNRNSIHLAVGSGDLGSIQTQLLTNEVGCVARDSIVQVGNNVLFLSDNGVYGANFQDLYNLRGNEVPLSEAINPQITLINKKLWDQSSAVYFDNRYYIAVPMNKEIRSIDENGNETLTIQEAQFNNAVLVFNFLNKQWESVDMVDNANFEYKQLLVAGDRDTRGVYCMGRNGGIHKLDSTLNGDDRIITTVALPGQDPDDLVRTPQVAGVMKTRMYTAKTIDRKKWNNFDLHIQSADNIESDMYLTGITENIDGTIDLKELSTYIDGQLGANEDVSVRGRLGNKRAYGFQMLLDRPQGRPRVRALKVGATEAFRSTNEAI